MPYSPPPPPPEPYRHEQQVQPKDQSVGPSRGAGRSPSYDHKEKVYNVGGKVQDALDSHLEALRKRDDNQRNQELEISRRRLEERGQRRNLPEKSKSGSATRGRQQERKRSR